MELGMKQNMRMAMLAAGLVALTSTAASARDTVRIAIPGFLTGGAAASMGIPAQSGAEIIVDAINNGTLPAPYNSKGLAGARIEVEFIDEAGGNNKQVAEFRNLVQKRGFDVVVGYVSSGTCQPIHSSRSLAVVIVGRRDSWPS
jgi:branched-chain amino acid transport system substrate-binding protein